MQAPSPKQIALALLAVGVALLINWSRLTQLPEATSDFVRWAWFGAAMVFFAGAAALFFLPAGRWPLTRRRQPRTIPLIEAATRAYEQTRAAGKLSAGVSEVLSDNALTWFCWALWERLELFGKWPPSRISEHIPWQRHNEFTFAIEGDKVRLCELSGKRKCFEDLHVTTAGFEAAIQKIMALG
jgi:hypothetical protein